jgi:hypothetical protein
MFRRQILTLFRRHILKDIDPYICLFEACDKPTNCFKTVNDWLNHTQWQHIIIWSCQSVGHESEFFDSSADFERHMKQKHDGEFSEQQLPFLVDKSARPAPDTFAALARARRSIGASGDITKLCPLCPFSADEPDMQSQSTPSSLSDGNGDGVFKKILNHIVSHMESIALLSLPAGGDLDSGVSNEPRSQGVEDITEQDNQDLPPAIFADEPIEKRGLIEEALPIDDYLMKNGWSRIFESPNVRKTTYLGPEHDKTLKAFVAALGKS